jgi:hypothetical protein
MIVHRFRMGDVEDAQIYAAGPIMKWQDSDAGIWVMENAISQPIMKTVDDLHNFGWAVEIHADFTPEDALYFTLRWGDEIEFR